MNIPTLHFWRNIPHALLHRIIFSWIIRFFTHAISILGVTIGLAYTIAFFGPENLPLLFIVSASFALIGTFIVQKYLSQLSLEKNIKILLVSFCVITIASLIAFFLFPPIVFLGIWLFGISTCIIQLHILISLYTEHLFSPIESEQAFPLIESAEAVGGIFSGFIAGIGAIFFSLTSLIFVEIFLGISMLLIMVFFAHEILFHHSTVSHSNLESPSIKKLWKKNILFRNLGFGIFLQGIIFIFIEFQYSLSITLLSDSVSVIGEKALFKELAHGLGLFHLSIYGVLFIFHVFFTQHIQHKLGIVYTIILQPIFIFLSACAMFISGSALVGMSGKGVYEVFGGVSKTAYHISFYAFRHNVRGDIKEFLEGYARQAGVLIGSFLILLVYSIVVALEGNLTQIFYFFSGCIAVFSLGKFIFFFRLKKNYTQIAKNNLETPGVIEEKFDAIEIFAQNGHENSIRILSNILHSSHEPLVLKKKILEVLGRRHEPLAIAEILSALSFGNQSLQLSAVKALSKNKYMEKYMKIHVFSRHQLITLLQKSFLHAKSKKLRLAIIQVFKKIQYPEIVLFLLRSLSNKERDIVFCAILACGTFDDISMGSYILPFLNHNDSYIRSAAIITLWPFVRYRSQAIKSLQEMENSKDEDMYMSSIYTKGEILQTSEIPYLEQSLKHETNPHIKKHILLSLIKMKKYEHIPQILQLMFHSDIKISESTKKLIFSPGIDKHLHHNIKYFLHRKIVHEVHKIYKKYPNTSLEELPQTKLRKLHFLYNIIDDELKMMEIEKIIEV